MSDYTHGRPYGTNEAWYTAKVRVTICTRPGVCIVTDLFIHTAGRVYNISHFKYMYLKYCTALPPNFTCWRLFYSLTYYLKRQVGAELPIGAGYHYCDVIVANKVFIH